MKKRVFKIVPFDEVNNVWILKENIWWIFYRDVSYGSKERLEEWVEKMGGILESYIYENS